MTDLIMYKINETSKEKQVVNLCRKLGLKTRKLKDSDAKITVGTLTGNGKIKNQSVNCINPKWMFKFKLWANDTSYEPREKDIIDAQALSEKFGYKLPEKYM